MIFGDCIDRYGGDARSIICEPEISSAGNIVLRIGRENGQGAGGWHGTEHVVLLPDEASYFIGMLTAALAKSKGDSYKRGRDDPAGAYDDDGRTNAAADWSD